MNSYMQHEYFSNPNPNQMNPCETPGYYPYMNPNPSNQMPPGKMNPSSSGDAKKKDGKPKKPSKKPPTKAMIYFDKLQAGTVSNSSGIFNGKNIQFGWSSHSKSNSGFGSLGGHNNMVNKNTNIIFDNDQIDTPIDDRDTMWCSTPAN